MAVVAMVCLLVIQTSCGADGAIQEEVEVGMIKVAPAAAVVSKPKTLIIIDWGKSVDISRLWRRRSTLLRRRSILWWQRWRKFWRLGQPGRLFRRRRPPGRLVIQLERYSNKARDLRENFTIDREQNDTALDGWRRMVDGVQMERNGQTLGYRQRHNLKRWQSG